MKKSISIAFSPVICFLFLLEEISLWKISNHNPYLCDGKKPKCKFNAGMEFDWFQDIFFLLYTNWLWYSSENKKFDVFLIVYFKFMMRTRSENRFIKTIEWPKFWIRFLQWDIKYSNSQIPKHIEHVILSFSWSRWNRRKYIFCCRKRSLALSFFFLICITDRWSVYVCDTVVCVYLCVEHSTYTMRLCMGEKVGERTVNVNLNFIVLDSKISNNF